MNGGNPLDKRFWETLWSAGMTGWDLGGPSRPLTEYIDGLKNKDLRILIPGCGNAHEADYLTSKGFKDVTLLDISSTACDILNEKFKLYPEIRIVNENLFEHSGSYDLILEQTLFCTLYPERRSEYAQKMHDFLNPNGKLAGVLFNTCLGPGGPPFGGDLEDYAKVFKPYFEILHLEDCRNSSPGREGKEYFIELKKK